MKSCHPLLLLAVVILAIGLGCTRRVDSAPAPPSSTTGAGTPAMKPECAALRELDRDIGVDDIFAFARNTKPTAENALVVGRHGGRIVELLRYEGIHVDVLDDDPRFVHQLRDCTSLAAEEALVGPTGAGLRSWPPKTHPAFPNRTHSIVIILDKGEKYSSYDAVKQGTNTRVVVTRWVDEVEHSTHEWPRSEIDFPAKSNHGRYEHLAVWERETELSRRRALTRARWPYEPQIRTHARNDDGSREIDVVGYAVRAPSGEVVVECPVAFRERAQVRIPSAMSQATLSEHLEGATFTTYTEPSSVSAAARLGPLVNTHYDANFGMTLSSVVVMVRGRARLVSWGDDRTRVYELVPSAPLRTITTSDWDATSPQYARALTRARELLEQKKLDAAVGALREAREQVVALVGDMSYAFELHRYVDRLVRDLEKAIETGSVFDLARAARDAKDPHANGQRFLLLEPEEKMERALHYFVYGTLTREMKKEKDSDRAFELALEIDRIGSHIRPNDPFPRNDVTARFPELR